MSYNLKCWVPNCNSSPDKSLNCLFFPLPADPKYRETWLALTGRKFSSKDNIYFCEDHFKKPSFEVVCGKTIGLSPRALPFFKMPQIICRTCLTTIPNSSFFCVVSSTIPSPVPKEMQTDVVPCRPEPLYHVLTFCIPNLNLAQNPPSLVCIKCYHTIWEYFLFKMKSNAMENRVREGLSAEEYGKVVLCRCCPDTSSSFFVLNESHHMGQVLKNMFISNFPKNVVPLKLCLKCWNIVYKLTEFQKNCINVDRLLVRCSELNEAQMYQNLQSTSMMPTLPEDLTTKYPFDQNQSAILPVDSLAHAAGQPQFGSSDQKPMTFNGTQQVQFVVKNWAGVASTSSSCSNNSNSVPGYSGKPFGGVKGPAAITAVSSGKQVSQLETIVLDSDDDSPKPLPKALVKVKFEPEVAARGRKKNIVPNVQTVLAELVLKHSDGLRTDLDLHAMAKLNLEMWTKVMNELLSLGYTVTLEHVQSVWNKMKAKTKSIRKVVGPKPYLEHLVDIYLTRTESKRNSVDGMPSSLESDEESRSSNATEKSSASSRGSVKYSKLKDTLHAKLTKKCVNAFEDRNVIYLDSGSETEEVSRSPAINAASSTGAFKTEELDKKIKSEGDRKCPNTRKMAGRCKTEDLPHIKLANPLEKALDQKPPQQKIKSKRGRKKKIVCDSKYPDTKNIAGRCKTEGLPHNKLANPLKKAPDQKPPQQQIKSKRGRKKKEDLRGKRVVDVWNQPQKLELVREMRKEYNYLISKGELGHRVHHKQMSSPWKKILERLAARGYKNCSFPKLYYLWSKMKMSATIYEKNGKDVVDDEVWELLQLHQDVHGQLPQTNKDRKTRGQNAVDQATLSSKSRPRSKSPPIKKLRTSTPKLENVNDIRASTVNYEHISRDMIQIPEPKDSSMNDTHTGWDLIQNTAIENTATEDPVIDQMHAGRNVIETDDIGFKNTYTDQGMIQISAVYSEHTGQDMTEIPDTNNHQVVGSEVLKLLKTYRRCSDDKKNDKCNKPLEEGSSAPHPVEGDTSRNGDQKKLDLISVVKSFGNEVFKTQERSTRMDFWARVTSEMNEKGHDMGQNLVRATWNNMLQSAKLTWAQVGRTPNEGDQEIIDFMTEVISNKQKSNTDSKLNLSVQEDEEVPEGSSVSVKREEDSGMEQDSGHEGSAVAGNELDKADNGDDYVSLEDLKKTYRKVSEKPKPVISDEVIEILDSD